MALNQGPLLQRQNDAAVDHGRLFQCAYARCAKSGGSLRYETIHCVITLSIDHISVRVLSCPHEPFQWAAAEYAPLCMRHDVHEAYILSTQPHLEWMGNDGTRQAPWKDAELMMIEAGV